MGYKIDNEQIVQIDNQQLQADIQSNSNKIGNLSATGYADLSAGIIDHTAQLADIAVNIKNFGAKGDGVTDDYQALKDAHDNVLSKGGGTVLIPSQQFKINSPFIPSPNVHFLFTEGGELVFEVTGEYAILMSDLTNSKWHNPVIKRAGTGGIGNNSVLVIKGNTDDSVKFYNGQFLNEMTSDTGVARSVHIYDHANPVFYNSIAKGGTSNYSNGFTVGAIANSDASPKFYNCIGVGGAGDNAFGFELDNTLQNDKSELHNCTGFGGSGKSSHGLSCDDTAKTKLFGCHFYGGQGDYSNGLTCYSTSVPIFENCFFKGGNGLNSYGVLTQESSPSFNNCTAEGGNNDYGQAWYLDDNSLPKLNNCSTSLASEPFRHVFSSANSGAFYPNTDHPFSIQNMNVVVIAAQSSGTKLNIGTTVGGNDIATDIPLDVAGWSTISLSNLIAKIRPANIPLYATVTGGAIVEDRVVIVGNAIFGYTNCHGLYIDSLGAKINNSNFISNSLSNALQITTKGISNNVNMKINNSVFETIRNEQNTDMIAINGLSSWKPIYFENNTIIGKLYNVSIYEDLISYSFYLNDVPTNLTNSVINAVGNSSKVVPLPKGGRIDSYIAQISAASTTGSCTIKVQSGGADVSGVPTATLGNPNTGKTVVVDKETINTSFNAGGNIYVTITTTSDWTPTTIDLMVTVFVRVSKY